MKNLSLIINAVLIIAVAGLYYMQLNEKQMDVNVKSPNALDTLYSQPAKSSSAKIAYIQTDTLWANLKLIQEIQEKLASQKLQHENQYNQELKKFEADYLEIQEKARWFTEAQAKEAQQTFAAKEQALMKLQEDLRLQFIKTETKENERIQKAISSFIDKYNANGAFDYVLGYNNTGNILYAHHQFDITSQAIKEMNAAYAEMNNTQP